MVTNDSDYPERSDMALQVVEVSSARKAPATHSHRYVEDERRRLLSRPPAHHHYSYQPLLRLRLR